MSNSSFVARDRTINIEPIIEYVEAFDKASKRAAEIEAKEKEENEKLQWSYQKWTHHDYFSYISYSVSFTDGGNVEYKNVEELKRHTLTQPSAIKSITVHQTFKYSSLENGNIGERDENKIYIYLTKNGFKIDYSIAPEETELEQTTTDFINKIEAMPIKLDRIIRQKDLIIMKVGFAFGMIPAIIVGIACLCIPQLHEMLHNYWWGLPLAVLVVAFLFGIFFGNMKLSNSYDKLIPKKYGGYDTRTHQSYHVDDMETFSEEVDVLIGEKSDLGKRREYIEKTEKRFAKLLLPELGALAILTLVAFLVTRL